MELEGKRILIVGASGGVGRGIGEMAGKRGARVAFAARRVGEVQAAAETAGQGSIGLACDVTDPQSCEQVVADTVAEFGGLDALVYAVAYGPLIKLTDADADLWAKVWATNVTGSTQVTRAAIPHLVESRGSVFNLSSVSGTTTPPWAGLALYGTTKAALERVTEYWQVEVPEVRFSSVVIGPINSGPEHPSTFSSDWDPALAAEMPTRWMGQGLMDGTMVEGDELSELVMTMLCCNAKFGRVVITP